MVTMPSEAAVDHGLIDDMVARGMDVARVNCAHDDADAWSQMAAALRARHRTPMGDNAGSRWISAGRSYELGHSRPGLDW